jgi:hypothetical protein
MSVPFFQVRTPGVFYKYFYNHARRLRLEKAILKPLLNPGGRFTSETAARRLQKCNGRHATVSEVKRLQIYDGYIHM